MKLPWHNWNQHSPTLVRKAPDILDATLNCLARDSRYPSPTVDQAVGWMARCLHLGVQAFEVRSLATADDLTESGPFLLELLHTRTVARLVINLWEGCPWPGWLTK